MLGWTRRKETGEGDLVRRLMCALLFLTLAIPPAHAKCVAPTPPGIEFPDDPEDARALCLYPKRHARAWRVKGYCKCLIVIPLSVRGNCIKPRKHFKQWRRYGVCCCKDIPTGGGADVAV